MAKTKPAIDYQALQTELEKILDELQDDLDVDTAMKHYERGLKIVKQLEDYLQNAENSVRELQAKFNHDA